MTRSASTPRTTRSVCAISEPLETRRLLTTTFYVQNGTVFINNDSDSSNVVINTPSANLCIWEGGVLVGYTSRVGVTGVVVNLNDGDDTFLAESAIAKNGSFLPVTVNGGEGNDSITTYAGNDVLNGDGGADYLDGFSGHDSESGNDGDDTIKANGGTDYIYGGNGTDLLDMTKGARGANVTLDGVANDITDGGTLSTGDNVMPDVEDFIGTKYADVIRGNEANNVIYGMLGNDTLYGGDGDDVLSGGGGKDVMYGEAGNDTIYDDEGGTIAAAIDLVYGGDGDDTFIGFYDGVNDSLFGGEGNDTVTDSDLLDLLLSIELSF